MKHLAAILIYLAVSIGGFMAWAFAIYTDAQAGRWVWMVADLVVPPLGALRGLLLYFF